MMITLMMVRLITLMKIILRTAVHWRRIMGSYGLFISHQIVRTRCLEAGRYTSLKVMTIRQKCTNSHSNKHMYRYTYKYKYKYTYKYNRCNYEHRQTMCWCFHWTFQSPNLSLRPFAQCLKSSERFKSTKSQKISIKTTFLSILNMNVQVSCLLHCPLRWFSKFLEADNSWDFILYPLYDQVAWSCLAGYIWRWQDHAGNKTY